MQNRYVGDIGDFGKYFLLKSVIPENLRLGVNWYLTEDENHNTDGKFVEYLQKPIPNEYSNADYTLYVKLRNIVFGKEKRSVAEIENETVLKKNTLFFSEIMNASDRVNWFARSCERLKKADIIFCDPDNGMEVKSCSIKSATSTKYTFFHELKTYYDLGKTLIVYQHANRQGKLLQQYEHRIQQLETCLQLSRKNIRAVYISKFSVRMYFFILQKNHTQEIRTMIEHLQQEPLFQTF